MTSTPISSVPNLHPASQSFQSLISEAIQKLVLIFGADITYARLNHIPEITFDKDHTLLRITGDHKRIAQQLLTLFRSLSPQAVESQLASLIALSQASTAEQESISVHKSSLPTVKPYIPEKIFI